MKYLGRQIWAILILQWVLVCFFPSFCSFILSLHQMLVAIRGLHEGSLHIFIYYLYVHPDFLCYGRVVIKVKAEHLFCLSWQVWYMSSVFIVKILGSRTARRTFEFGRTHVVRPKGKHQATIVWLHGLGDNGSR